MAKISRRTLALAGAAFVMSPYVARAQKKYDPGVSNSEIRLGSTAPYSGPVSAYGAIGTATTAYWRMVNDSGGINGRKVTFISYDDGFVPSKTVELVRKLVEDDNVFAIFNLVGSATNAVIEKYLNQKKVPQLFVGSGASKFGDPAQYPWTMGFQPDYATEAGIYAKDFLANHKGEKVGVLYQNDDAGKDGLAGFRKALGPEGVKQLSLAVSYEVTDPTVESQVIQLKGSGASVISMSAGSKYAAQAIRKMADLAWRPTIYLATASASVAATLKPAGLENSKGVITAAYMKDPTDPQWANASDYLEWKAWMAKYLPESNIADSLNVTAYTVSAALRHVLEKCGDDLTRGNLMKQAASLKSVAVPMLLPGITLNTSPTDYYPVQSMQLARFDGETWKLYGDVISNESS